MSDAMRPSEATVAEPTRSAGAASAPGTAALEPAEWFGDPVAREPAGESSHSPPRIIRFPPKVRGGRAGRRGLYGLASGDRQT
jgi:hypothetical protein